MRKILFFGDSLTAGYAMAAPDKESYPALIQQKLTEQKLPFECINAGVSGDTSSSGLARIDRWLINPIDIFILELGVNDFLRGLPASATATNLDQILARVKKKYPDCKLCVLGLEPDSLRIPSFLLSPKVEEFRTIFRKLAEKYDAKFVPFFLEGVAGVKQLNLPDGLHPNSKGYAVIAEHVWPTVQQMLR